MKSICSQKDNFLRMVVDREEERREWRWRMRVGCSQLSDVAHPEKSQAVATRRRWSRRKRKASWRETGVPAGLGG